MRKKCKYHCVKCGRHFADEKTWRSHYDRPGIYEGCHKPPAPAESEFGICNVMELGPAGDPHHGVRVYYGGQYDHGVPYTYGAPAGRQVGDPKRGYGVV